MANKGTISRRGAWRESFQVYSASGATDPSLYVFRVRLWPTQGGCGCAEPDEVWGASTASIYELDASTDDETGRIVGTSNGTGLMLTWSFPVDVVSRLSPGAYAGSITAAPESNTADAAEISSFVRVIK